MPSMSALDRIEINVDCGEGFGQWPGGPDEQLMPLIDAANVACGGHAGDPVTMRKTIALAKKHGVKVGAREFGRFSTWSELIRRPRIPRQGGLWAAGISHDL